MDINQLQRIAESKNLTIKIQVREVLGLKIFRIIVAQVNNNSVKIWGEIKGWTLPIRGGLQLDTLRILNNSPKYVSALIWATTMAWALEKTKCKFARLLAIYDSEGYSKKLVRYFRLIGFTFIKVPAPPHINLKRRSEGEAPTSLIKVKPINLKYLTSFLLYPSES